MPGIVSGCCCAGRRKIGIGRSSPRRLFSITSYGLAVIGTKTRRLGLPKKRGSNTPFGDLALIHVSGTAIGSDSLWHPQARGKVRVSDVISRSIVTTPPDATVEGVVQQTINHRISVVPVVAGDGRLAGIVTAGDLLRRAEIRTRRRRSRRSGWLLSDSPLAPEEALSDFLAMRGFVGINLAREPRPATRPRTPAKKTGGSRRCDAGCRETLIVR